ncbi:MAG: hypothetical protein SOW30_03640 [Parabacteroides sp.]|nr:hypothetical protein [Parabacteroides sp.]
MSVICTRCGGTDVACEAIINPNGYVFRRYTDESFLYGRCEDCREYAELTDPDNVKKAIRTLYGEFMSCSTREPDYADCRIVYKDNGKALDVRISLHPYDEESDGDDDDIFFCCESVSDLVSLADYGAGDFILTECYRFNHWTEEEKWTRKTYHVDVKGTHMKVTGREIRELYGANYPLDKDFVEKHGVRTVAERKWYRSQGELLTPLMVSRICKTGCRCDKDLVLSFRLQLHFLWHVNIIREKEEWCLPYKYSLTAVCLDAPNSFGRRYTSFDNALLHCLNGFNENATIKDRYASVEDYLSKNKCLHTECGCYWIALRLACDGESIPRLPAKKQNKSSL